MPIDTTTVGPLLVSLASQLRGHIEEQLAAGGIVAQHMEVTRRVVSEFKYGDRGIERCRTTYQPEIVSIWRYDASPFARTLLEWKAITDAGVDEQSLLLFVERMNHIRLYEGALSDERISQFVGDLMKTVEGRPIRFCVDIRFSGIVLRSEPIDIPIPGGTIAIRATQASDLEGEELPSPAGFHPHSFDTVGTMVVLDHSANNVQEKVRWFSCLAQLVLCASIRETEYQITYNSCSWLGSGRIGAGDIGVKYRIGKVTEENRDDVIRAFEAIGQAFPPAIVAEEQSKVDSLAVAFHRYVDALVVRGLIERRLATVVMGLESLFLSDKDVIGYKLSLRLAKLLGSMGFDPHQVKRRVSDAYTVRSKFVHGDTLNNRDMKAIEKRHGSIERLFDDCLVYLRASLIAAMISLKSKDDRIRLIDEAMIDDGRIDALQQAARNLPGIALIPTSESTMVGSA